ncbi:MAG: plasmid recombination protein [Clostridia bacterium]|nr:plasmid recombination protein [Clostridia bacterium]
MQRTISIMTGKGSVNHNDRKFTAENVDKERTQNNITYCNENIRTVYHKLFDDAVKRHNERQTRSDRQIANYYKKISQESKQEKPFQEIIVQIGDKDNMGAMTENGQLAKKILDEYMKGFQDRNPNLYVFSAHLHMDEATPHLHIDFVPFTTGSKRGLDTRVSMKGALKQQGFIGTGRSDTERAQWAESEKEALSKIMLSHGIEWEQKGTHEKHKTVSEFKRDMLSKEIDELTEKKDVLLHTMSAYTKAEEYAHLTVQKIKDNDDFDVPEPPPLMSAKTYKTKFIEPFIKRIMKIIENLARRCYRAEKIAEQAEAKVKPLEAENERLKGQLWNKNMALSKAEVKVRDYERIKSYVGVEQINRWLKEIVHLGKNRSRSNNHIER